MALTTLLVLILCAFANGVIVKIPELGDVLGTTTKSLWSNRIIYEFRSIKYGKIPAENRKFAQSIPAGPWEGLYNATVQGTECPQIFSTKYMNTTEEDIENCLSLNVFSPINPEHMKNRDKLLPVLIFIHGGGFVIGGNSKFPPNFLLEKDILLVTVQYRLGVLGALCLHTDAIAGNMGLLDQVLSLKWINKYIKHFGGNNSDVTLMGQSSGAFSVSAHLLSPAVEPHLFQKAIIQSGAAFAHWGVQTDPIGYAERLYRRLTNDTNVVSVDALEKTFLNASMQQMVDAFQREFTSDYRSWFQTFGAVVQKAGKIKYLTAYPNEIIKTGHPKTLPLLAGVTKYDGSIFSYALYEWLSANNLSDNNEYIRYNITSEIIDSAKINDISGAMENLFYENSLKHIFKENRPLKYMDVHKQVTDFYSILGFKSQVLKQVKLNSRFVPNTYMYAYDYVGEHSTLDMFIDKPLSNGAEHSDEMYLLFPIKDLNKKDTAISAIMIDLWTSFVISGKPYSKALNINWPEVIKGKNGPYIHINSAFSIGEDFAASEFFTTKTGENHSTNGISSLNAYFLYVLFFAIFASSSLI